MPPPDYDLLPSEEDTPRPAVQAEGTINAALNAQVDPEQEGRLFDLSRKTGVDMGTLRMQSLPHLSALDNLPSRTDVFKRQSDIAQWLVDNPIHASIAQDDAAQLEHIKNSMPDWIQQDRQYHHDTIGERLTATGGDIGRALPAGLGQISRGVYGILRFGADAVGADQLAQYASEQAEIGDNLPTHIRQAVFGMSFDDAQREESGITRLNYLKAKIGSTEISAGDVGSGLVSILPTLAAGPLGWGAVLGAAGAQTFGGAYADLRDRGDSVSKAGAIGMVEGVITAALTHFIPGAEGAMRRMLQASASKTQAARAVFAKAMGATAAGEFTEEGLDQFAQTVLNESTDTKNPKDWQTVLGHAVSEGLKAGLIGGFTGGVFGHAEAHHEASVQAAHNFFEGNGKLAAAVDSSKMGQRSKVAMEEYLQSQGMRKGANVYFSAEDIKPMIGTSPEQTAALAELGLTADAVEAAKSRGGSLSVSASKFMTADPGTRTALLELARQKPSSLSEKEAKDADKESELRAKDGVDPKKIETKKSKFVQELNKQQVRIIKEAVAATGQDEKTVRALHQPLFEKAKAQFLRDPLAARSPIDFLKALRYNKKGMSREETMQAITDMAGPEGKTALSKVSFTDLGQLSGRFDALTGRLELNEKALPDTVSLAEIVASTKNSKLDLAGKTVHVPDQSGTRQAVDASAAVSTLQERVEAAHRLAACL